MAMDDCLHVMGVYENMPVATAAASADDDPEGRQSCSGEGRRPAREQEEEPATAAGSNKRLRLSSADCSICLEQLRPSERCCAEEAGRGDVPVRLACGHAFHGLTCFTTHIESTCLEVETRVQGELSARFDALGLAPEDRRQILGGDGSFVDMRQMGQLRQCPQCGYGPVMNVNCDNLQAHDAERGQGTGRTTNHCPNCSYFSPRWTDWKIWNLEDPSTAVRCPLCRDPCCLSREDTEVVAGLLAEADRELADAYREHCDLCFLGVDFFAIFWYLQEEVGLAQSNADRVFESLVRDRDASDHVRALLESCPIGHLLRQRLSIEQDGARGMHFGQLRRLLGTAEDRLHYSRQLLCQFNSAAGFDGVACASALRALLPLGAVSQALQELERSAEFEESDLDAMLARVAAELPMLSTEAAAQVQPGESAPEAMEEHENSGAIATAIGAARVLAPDIDRFKRAWARQDFVRAMTTAEKVKRDLADAIRPLASAGGAVMEELRGLRWDGESFAELPDIEALVAVLERHRPWHLMPSSVANCPSFGPASAVAAAVVAADAAASASAVGRPAMCREQLNRQILTFAQAVLTAHVGAEHRVAAGAVAGGLRQRCEDLAEKRRRLALLLFCSRRDPCSVPARSLEGRPWQPYADPRAPPGNLPNLERRRRHLRMRMLEAWDDDEHGRRVDFAGIMGVDAEEEVDDGALPLRELQRLRALDVEDEASQLLVGGILDLLDVMPLGIVRELRLPENVRDLAYGLVARRHEERLAFDLDRASHDPILFMMRHREHMPDFPDYMLFRDLMRRRELRLLANRERDPRRDPRHRDDERRSASGVVSALGARDQKPAKKHLQLLLHRVLRLPCGSTATVT